MAEKVKFYTLHRTNEKSKVKLMEHSGYYDGEFLYYGSFNVWHAIDPKSGLSIAAAPSAKEVKAKVHDKSLMEKFEKAKHTPEYLSYKDQYQYLKRRMKNGIH